jgi:hypothetical protein
MGEVKGGWGPRERDFPDDLEVNKFLDVVAGSRAQAPASEGKSSTPDSIFVDAPDTPGYQRVTETLDDAEVAHQPEEGDGGVGYDVGRAADD